MKYDKDDRDAAGPYAYAAAMDAQRRNKENYNNFSKKLHVLAEKLGQRVAATYAGDVYTNYRKTEICVKVKGRADRVQLAGLEKFCDENKITGAKTKSGSVIYRIKA